MTDTDETTDEQPCDLALLPAHVLLQYLAEHAPTAIPLGGTDPARLRARLYEIARTVRR